MSDFFTNLAARARDTRTAIRPRLPKRFEPVATTAQLARVALEADRAAQDVPSILSQARIEATTADPPSQEEQERRRPGLPAPPAPPPMEVDLERPSESSQVGISDAATPIAQQLTATMAPPARTGAADPTLPSPPPESSGVDVRLSFVAHRATNATTALPHRSTEPRRNDLTPASVPISETTLLEAVPAPPQAPSPPLNQRELKVHAARPVRAPPPTQREPAAPAETTVHVSIGRIELRVPPAAPSKKRERTASPVAPLADYLQQHSAARKRP